MKKVFTIKAVNEGANKLRMVFLIKEFTDLSLTESRDLLNSVSSIKPLKINLKINSEQEKVFLKKLEDVTGIDWLFNDPSYRRQLKLIQLGLIDNKKELIEILKREFNSTIFLDDILNSIPEQRLVELIKQIK